MRDMHDLNEIYFEFDAAIQEWDDRGEDDAHSPYREDAADLDIVFTLLKQGDVDGAWFLASRLDTIVREVIPDIAWNYMQEIAGDED